jgi:hypothetical protein
VGSLHRSWSCEATDDPRVMRVTEEVEDAIVLTPRDSLASAGAVWSCNHT